MRLWDWLLDEIGKRPEIAANKAEARSWIKDKELLRGVDQHFEIHAGADWDADWRAFRRNVDVIRKISAAEKGGAEINLMVSDKMVDVVQDYIGRLRIVIDHAPKQSVGWDWTTTYAQITPTAGSVFAHGIEDLDVFWQLVFASKFCPTLRFPPVCRECGKELPTKTPTGRTSAKSICARCSTRLRRGKMPDRDRKAENRRHQHNRRRRLRRGGSPE